MLERYWTFAREKVAEVHLLIAARARRPSAPIVEAEPPAEAAPLSVADRWTRATGAVTAAIAGFGRIESLQAAAASQIDAADYTLQRLLGELSTVMPILPADGSALRALLATVAEPEVAAEKKTLAA
jgi:hypothetical protein